jgi:hypothetical protein
MSADYAPGTVAVATVRGVPGVRVIRGGATSGAFTDYWFADRLIHGSASHFHESVVTDVRPLVALDPTNYPTLDVAEHFRAHGLPAFADAWAAQTRPPKPAEPTGLGAVVEDAAGYWWVSASHDNRRQWYRDNVRSGWRDYADGVES